MIKVDGSYGEGGGQILRTSIALSTLLGVPVEIYNIRAKRPNPGLQPQHLTGVQAAAALSNAEMEGAFKGSTRLIYRPGSVRCGVLNIDIGTAGSVSLVIQTLGPILALAPCHIKLIITGGTDVAWAPPIDYMRYIFATFLEKLGASIRIQLLRRGHYPRGGGQVAVEANPAAVLRPVEALEFGQLEKIGGVSHAVNLPRHVAERQAKAARETLAAYGYDAEIEIEVRDDGLGPGSGVVLWARSTAGHTVGGDALGERGKPAETVGREAAERLLKVLKSGASTDPHLADMAVLYMALARGRSVISTSEWTSHLETNIYIVERFLPVKFKTSTVGGRHVIEVEGVGFSRRT